MKWRFINSDIRRWPFPKIIPACIASCLTVYYCAELHLGALELLRFMAGALALWIPLGGWLYVLLRNEVPDRIIRIAFSAGSSYALTTLFYFGAATLHCSWLFYFAQIAAVAGLIFYAIKNKAIVTKDLRSFSHFDWVLAALVAASMVANIRAQLVYHYAVIQVLMCLLLYGIGKTLAASRIAGYCTLALMYVAVPPAPNLWPVAVSEDLPVYPVCYFTVFPHLCSGLDPVVLAAPQMYSCLVVLYAGMLGLLL